MSIQDLGAIGEFIGSILVLITLVYLALQVRANTIAVKSSEGQSFHKLNQDIVGALPGDRELTDLWMRAGDQFESLDAVDQRRMIFFESRVISAWNHYFHMHQQGMVGPHMWAEIQWITSNMGQRGSMKAAWLEWRHGYLDDYRAWLDGQIFPDGLPPADPLHASDEPGGSES